MAQLPQSDPKFSVIQAATLGDNLLVAAVPGKRIKVIGYRLSASGSVTVKFRSNTSDITGLAFMSANQNTGKPGNPGLFRTNPGEALNLNLSANVAVGGHLTFCEVG
jgi:hypothetical protein